MKTLYQFEIKKIFNTKLFLFSLVSLLIVLLATMWLNFYNSQMASGKGYSTREAIQYNQKIAQKFDGNLDDDKIKDILDSYLSFYKESIENPDKITNEPMNVFAYYVSDTMLDASDNLPSLVRDNPDITIDEVDIKPLSALRISDSINDVKMTTFFSWSDLFKTIKDIFIPIVIVIVIVISGIFANEKSQNLDKIILPTKHGRNKLTTKKIIAGFSISIPIFLTTITLILIAYSYLYGLSGWDGSIQANFYLKTFNFPLPLNNIQVLFIILFIQLLNIIMITSITMLFSSYLNSAFSTMIASLTFIALPAGINKIFLPGNFINKIHQYMPINNFTLKNILDDMGFNNTFLFDNFWSNLIVIILMTVIGSSLCIGIIHYHQKHQYIS
ncbi:TPA: ABC transporter permease subunit [Streptococcus suis]|uniref:ABC transporter permease subunit n=1 Tax=Streptococcus suis TaxID=1307 RepID=UPI002AA418C7|nr:ABC transporter permease subunit [Streptococcus suis]HEM2759527.1 ABC transporter permease subunit [Streptococcus suis]HEM2766066.1 ABC transporter permease subunit [Streptococcus suis]HEM3590669.1 ABC transporter permease subunit [Streptococcus suis]